jgi:hypothetical protein
MLELLRENGLPSRFRAMVKESDAIRIAVPFWGEGAIKSLAIGGARNVRILCNLSSGACNPYVIDDLLKLGRARTDRRPVVRTNPRLHAKIYAGSDIVIVGSSNASANGLSICSGGEPARSGWYEANVVTDEEVLVSAANDFFEELWDMNETKQVTKPMLDAAKNAWNTRPKLRTPVVGKTLFEACREQPELFRSFRVFAYESGLDPDQKAKLREVKKQAATTTGRQGKHVGTELQSADFKNASGFDFGDWKVQPGTSLIDLDCRKGAKNAKVSGPYWVTGLTFKSCNLTIAISRPYHSAAGKLLRISSKDRETLRKKANRILRCDELLSLSDVIRMIDGR